MVFSASTIKPKITLSANLSVQLKPDKIQIVFCNVYMYSMQDLHKIYSVTNEWKNYKLF